MGSGTQKKPLGRLTNIMAHLVIIDTDIHIEFVTKSISEQAFKMMKKFRSSHGVEINDMLIAATSLILEVGMISKNQKHYNFLPDIELLEYPLSGE